MRHLTRRGAPSANTSRRPRTGYMGGPPWRAGERICADMGALHTAVSEESGPLRGRD